MRADEWLASLKARFKDGKVGEILIGADEVADWPEGAFAAFENDRLLAPATPADTLVCLGCEEACFMPVNILPAEAGRPTRAFIACDQRDDMGRVRVEFSRLRQWRLSRAALEKVEAKFILVDNHDNHGTEVALKKSKAPATFRAALRDLLAEIDERAKAQGLDFSPAAMPGRKVDFKALADAYDAELGGLAIATFDDYLVGMCSFRRGARETDFYRRLFPEAFK